MGVPVPKGDLKEIEGIRFAPVFVLRDMGSTVQINLCGRCGALVPKVFQEDFDDPDSFMTYHASYHKDNDK